MQRQLDGTSWVNREVHAQICGGRRGRFPPPTRHAAFVIDLFSRKVVGWKVSASLAAALALDALEMAVSGRIRAGASADGLVHHSDRGGQPRFKGSSQQCR